MPSLGLQVPVLDFSHRVLIESNDLLAAIRHFTRVYIEHPGDSVALQSLVSAVDHAHNTFKLIECHGAELVCKELLDLLAAIKEERLDTELDTSPVLVLASEKLSEYIGYLKTGGKDLPLALLSCCNNLRACYGEAFLSEALIVTPFFDIPENNPFAGIDESSLESQVRSYREYRVPLMQSLVDWYQSDSRDNLDQIVAVLRKLKQVSHGTELVNLWWAGEAVALSIGDGGLDSSIAVKRLFAHMERYLKELSDDTALDHTVAYPSNLLKNLLYYVALSESEQETVRTLKSHYRLRELLPPKASIQKARDALGGASLKLSEAICSSISREIGEVKSLLENIDPVGAPDGVAMESVTGQLSQISSTLLLLGLNEARCSNERAIQLLTDNSGHDLQAIVPFVATDLLHVESTLEEYLHGKVRTSVFADDFQMGVPGQLSVYQFDGIVDKCLSEAVRGIISAQTDFLDLLSAKIQPQELHSSASNLSAISQALQILPLPEIKPLLDGAAAYLSVIAESGVTPSTKEQTHFADLLVSCEYYLDPHIQSQPAAGELLLLAEEALSSLGSRSVKELSGASTRGFGTENSDSVIEYCLGSLQEISDSFQLWKQLRDTRYLNQMQHHWRSLTSRGSKTDSSPLVSLGISNDRLIARVLHNNLAAPSSVDQTTIELTSVDLASVDLAIEESVSVLPQIINNLAGKNGAIEDVVPGFSILLEKLDNICAADSEADKSPVEPLNLNSTAEVTDQPLEEDWEDKTILVNNSSVEFDETTDLSGLELHNAPENELVIGLSKYDLNGKQPDDMANATEDVTGELGDTVGFEYEVTTLLSEQAPRVAQVSSNSGLVGSASNHKDDSRNELTGATEGGVVAEQSELAAAELTVAELASNTDHTLLDVFFSECQMHVEDLKDELGTALANEKKLLPSERMLRSLHTLHGSAQTAEVHQIVSLVQPLEEISCDRHSQGRFFNKNEVVVISDALLFLENLCIALREGHEVSGNFELVRSSLINFVSDAHTEPAPDINKSSLQILFLEEAGDLLRKIHPLVVTLKAGKSALPALSVSKEEALNTILGDLHTLKGAAHVAGYRAIATLTHSLEGALERWSDELPLNNTRADLVQDSVDAITMNLEQAKTGGALGQFEWLISALGAEPAQSTTQNEGEASALDRSMSAASIDDHRVQTDPASLTKLSGLKQSVDKIGAVFAEKKSPLSEAQISEAQKIEIFDIHAGQELREKNEAELVSGLTSDTSQSKLDGSSVSMLSDMSSEVAVHQALTIDSVQNIRDLMFDFEKTTERLKNKFKEFEETNKSEYLPSDKDATIRFDPAELEGYTKSLEDKRQIGEILSDLDTIKSSLFKNLRDSEENLVRSSRLGSDIQQTLLESRLIPISQHSARLGSTIRQTAASLGKKVDWVFNGSHHRIDRNLHKAVLPMLEHLIRNAIVHGIEKPEERLGFEKQVFGQLTIAVATEGNILVISVTDDGAGVDVQAVREKLNLSIVQDGAQDGSQDCKANNLMEALFKPGFTTRETVDKFGGRGIGLDVVARLVKIEKGRISLTSEEGVGTTVTMRFPQSELISQVVVVECGGNSYGIPVDCVRTVKTIGQDRVVEFDDNQYCSVPLENLIDSNKERSSRATAFSPQAVLVEAGGRHLALRVSVIPGYRELISMDPGVQVRQLPYVSGGSILGDGRCVLIPDMKYLSEQFEAGHAYSEPSSAQPTVVSRKEILVVDDSVTMRGYAAKLLAAWGFDFVFARDGVEACEYLATTSPEAVLLDLEMPRMNGFEVLEKVRHDSNLELLPIVIISSRSSAAYRERASLLGVEHFLVKPYRSEELMRIFSHLKLLSTSH